MVEERQTLLGTLVFFSFWFFTCIIWACKELCVPLPAINKTHSIDFPYATNDQSNAKNRFSLLTMRRQLCLRNNTIDVSVLPHTSFMLYACTLTPYQCLPLFVYSMQLLFLRDTNIKPSDRIFPCEPYLLIDNQCSWKDTFVATCVLLEHGLGQAWLSVTGEVVFQDKDCWSGAAKETALLSNSSFFFPYYHSSQVPSLT